MVLGKCWGRDGGAGALWRGKDISLLSLALEVWVTPALSGLLPVHTNSGVASDSLEAFNRIAVIPSKSSSLDASPPLHSCPCHSERNKLTRFHSPVAQQAYYHKTPRWLSMGVKTLSLRARNFPTCVPGSRLRGARSLPLPVVPAYTLPRPPLPAGAWQELSCEPYLCSEQSHSHSHQPL